MAFPLTAASTPLETGQEQAMHQLAETKLAVVLEPADLATIESLGDFITLEPGRTLFRPLEPSGDMYIIISGDVNLYRESSERPVVWLGPGDILGEIGFFLGIQRTTEARAGSEGCRLWHIHRSIISRTLPPELMVLLTKLFVGMAPYTRVRAARFREALNPEPDISDNHCDHRHPSIQHMAAFLRQDSDWETLYAIWDFVRHIPYRIGFWNIKASRTLELGFGMCTSKSNLQVALMRACGIESAFGETECPSDCMTPIVPHGYHHILKRKPQIRHYLAVARIRGLWYPCDATCSPALWKELGAGKADVVLRVGEPFNPLNEISGIDPLDLRLCESLSHVMGKQPFYKADNVEAMNIVLDKIQGPFLQVPQWSASAMRMLYSNLLAAFRRAYAGIITELYALYSTVRNLPQIDDEVSPFAII
jgi:transglutaminase-like putative cysteine protease